MPLDAKSVQLLERALAKAAGDDPDSAGPRLVDDARRLWGRAQTLLAANVLPDVTDTDAIELACYALQLPLRQPKSLPAGKLGRTNLRDRAEQAAEAVVGAVGGRLPEALVDRATQILHELPQRAPMLDEARLLSDAVNLDDFGVTGLLVQVIQLCRTGSGIALVADGLEKREQYGYWDARLKDGFHFELARQIARARLEHTRKVAALLVQELKEDRAM